MKEPAARSPFAALDSREQKERWICWQSQRLAEQPTQEPTNAQTEQKSVLSLEKQTNSRFAQKPQGGEYASVVRRMQRATQKAQDYVPWPSEESTTQPSSGS